MKNLFKGNKVTLTLAIIVSVFFVVTTVSAVTTISTAIATAGNITTTDGNIEATAGTLTIGGASTFTGLSTLGSLKVGSNGTTVTRIQTGTCYIDPYATTIAASSTVSVDCQGTLAADADGSSALTGVTSSGFVQTTLSTTTAGNTFLGLDIIGASASTTAGHIELKLRNFTGSTYTWSTTSGTASGTASYIVFQ